MNIARIINRTFKQTAGAALLAGVLLMVPAAANARVFLSVNVAPPVIPVYEQPPCPGDGYIWTPGYWAWNDYNAGYEWVEGSWVVAPYVGALWTPGYWGWSDNAYIWNAGYWGREVGYYGGVNYGFGYSGTGFYGGYWGGNRFFYNRAYNRVDERREHNIYDRREAGFDGRPGGASFDRRYAGRGELDQNRGSFAGLRDDRNGGRGSFAEGRNFAAQDQNRGINQGEGRNFSGTNNRQPFQGEQGLNNRQQFQGGQTNNHTNYQVDQNRQVLNQSFNGGNRSNFQSQPSQPVQNQGFSNRSGFQGQPNQTTQPRQNQGFNGNRSNVQSQPTQPMQPRQDSRFTGGSPDNFRGTAMRSSNTVNLNNNAGGRSFSGGNQGSTNPGGGIPNGGGQGSFHGGNPGGGNNFRGGDARGDHR